MLDHNKQIILFILFLLIVLFIFNFDYKKNIIKDKKVINTDIEYKEDINDISKTRTNDVLAYDKEYDKLRKNICKCNDNSEYDSWKKQWTGRNNPTKRCYQNCQGLRKNENLYCVERCMGNDAFYLYP